MGRDPLFGTSGVRAPLLFLRNSTSIGMPIKRDVRVFATLGLLKHRATFITMAKRSRRVISCNGEVR